MAVGKGYSSQIAKLFPRGLAWFFDNGKTNKKLVDVLATEASIVDAAACSFIDEFFPDTTSAFLSDWERVAGLPGECDELAETVSLRRKDLKQKLTSRGGQSPQYFIDLAAALGFTITITEFKPFMVSKNAVGDALWNEDWWFAWQVNAPLNTVDYFSVGQNAVGDPLASWGNERLECVLEHEKPGQTELIFAYS